MRLLLQMFKFMLVGIASFIIDYVMLFVLTEYFDVYYLLSSFVSFASSLIFNYIFSMKFVFHRKVNMSLRRQFTVFVLLSVIGMILNQYIIEKMVEIIGAHYMLAKVCATMAVTGWNFVSRKTFLEERIEDL